METLETLIAEQNQELEEKGLPRLPHKNSPGYAWRLEKEAGIQNEPVGSNEERAPDVDEVDKFKIYVNTVTAKHKIKAQCIVMHDEFQEKPNRRAKKVRTSKSERQGAGALKCGIRRWVADTTCSRMGYTCGVFLAPVIGILAHYVCFKRGKISKANLKLIRKQCPDLSVDVNHGGGISTSVHTHFVLDVVLRKGLEKLHGFWKFANTEPSLTVEDLCPGHVGDKDKNTKEIGLRSKRIGVLRSLHSHRALTPAKSNPWLLTNDQIHKDVHLDVNKECQEMVGLQKDATKRPRGDQLASGGKFVAKCGTRPS
jgi:hypothetical protein